MAMSASASGLDDKHLTSPVQTGNNRWRAQDIIFAFGANDDYFISASRWSWRFWGRNALSDSFDCLKGGKPIAVALTPDGGGLWVYEDAARQIRTNLSTANMNISSLDAESWTYRHKQYEKISEFLCAGDEDGDSTTNIAVSIGSQGRWFAQCGTKVGHHGLPKDIVQETDQKAADGIYPRQFALGGEGDYVVLWSCDEGAQWSLTSSNACLKYLKAGENLNTIVLSPYNADAFFIVTENGEVLHSISGLPQSQITEICSLSKAFMQRTARTFQKTLIWDARVNGRAERLEITPETRYDEPAWSTDALQQRFFFKSWRLQRLERSVTDRSTLAATGTAAAVSALVVASMSWTIRRNAVAAAGASAASTLAATRLSRLPTRSGALAAGLAAIGTTVACSFILPET